MNDKWRTALEAVNRELEAPSPRHLDTDELTAYVQGQMAEAEHQAAQSHLVQCAACLAQFKDVQAFFAPAQDETEAPGKKQRQADWQTVWQRVQPTRPATGFGRSLASLFLSPKLAWATVAGLVFVVGLSGFGAWRLRQENQALAIRLRAEQGEVEKRINVLEQEKRERDLSLASAEAQKQAYETQIAELKKPQVNTPIHELYSFQQKSGEPNLPIALPSNAKSYVLRLITENQVPYEKYKIEILDQKSQMIFSADGLQRDSTQNFAITLPQGFLKQGKYRVKLSGQMGNRSQPLAEYLLQIS